MRGLVLFLFPGMLEMADLWEGVPYYTRTVERVLFRGRKSLVWVYSRPDADGTDADEGGICDLPRDEVAEAVRALARERLPA